VKRYTLKIYCEMTNQNCIHEEIKSRLKLVNVFYHLVFTTYYQGDQMRLRWVWHVRGERKNAYRVVVG